MKKTYNIAVVGLGQVGIYLLNELNTKKKSIETKTGSRINLVAISAKNIKRSLPKSNTEATVVEAACQNALC